MGYGDLVGAPLSIMLAQDSIRGNATVTCTHIKTRDLAEHTRRADILVAAAGVPQLITGDMIKPGATVVDVGVHRTADGLVGDVQFDEVVEVAGAITPVPGGVGPMTVAMLLVNTVAAAEAAAYAVTVDDSRRRRRPARRAPSRPAVRRDGRDRAAALRERRRGDRARPRAGRLDRRRQRHRQPHRVRAHVGGGGRVVRRGRRHRAHAAADGPRPEPPRASRPSCSAGGRSAPATCCVCPAIRSRSATIPTRRW